MDWLANGLALDHCSGNQITNYIMTTRDENLFWSELPKTKLWKKIAVITGSILFAIIIVFSIASMVYGYGNISSLVRHGHFEPVAKSQNIAGDVINQNKIQQSAESNSSSADDNLFSSNPDYNFSTATKPTDFYNNDSKNNSTTQRGTGTSLNLPEYDSNGAVAICNDYTYSHEQHSSSTCSSHGGIMYWLDGSDSNSVGKKKVCVENTAMEQLLEQQYQNQVNSIKQQETYELGQAQVDLATRWGGSSSGSFLAYIQSIKDKYVAQLSNLKNEYDQKINTVEPICHYE